MAPGGGSISGDSTFTSSHWLYDTTKVEANKRLYTGSGITVGGNSFVSSGSLEVFGGFTAKQAASTSGGMTVYSDNGVTELFKTVR